VLSSNFACSTALLASKLHFGDNQDWIQSIRHEYVMYAANTATYQYHALGKKDLHVCLLRDKVFNNITKNREADQISYCESERHLVGMHWHVNAGLLGLWDEGVLSPNCKETHENRSAGVPSENAWCSSILRGSGRLVVVQHLLRGVSNLGGGRSLQGSISAHIGALLWFRDAVWGGLGVSRGSSRCKMWRIASPFIFCGHGLRSTLCAACGRCHVIVRDQPWAIGKRDQVFSTKLVATPARSQCRPARLRLPFKHHYFPSLYRRRGWEVLSESVNTCIDTN